MFPLQDPSHAQMQNHVQEPLPVHVGASQVPARVQVNMQRRGLVSGMAMPNTALPCSHVGLDGMNPASGLHAAIAPGGGLFGAGGGASTLTNQTQTPQLQQVVSGHPPDLLPSSMRSMPMMAGQLPFPVGPPPLPQGAQVEAFAHVLPCVSAQCLDVCIALYFDFCNRSISPDSSDQARPSHRKK